MENDINDKYFHSEPKDEVMFLHLNSCLFLEHETFSHRSQLLDFLDEVNESNSIKTLVVNYDHQDFNLENYKEKWDELYNSQSYEGNILRVFRTFNQIFLKLKSMQKIVLSVFTKPVNAMLFSLGMASDLRFVSRDFYIDNNNHNFVNIPKGGAAFVGLRLMYVNPIKMLFQSDKVFPTDLYQKHIIDEIIDIAGLMDMVFSVAKRFSQFDYVEFEAVKIVEQSRIDILDISLQKENDYLLSCIRKKKNLNDRHLARIK